MSPLFRYRMKLLLLDQLRIPLVSGVAVIFKDSGNGVFVPGAPFVIGNPLFL